MYGDEMRVVRTPPGTYSSSRGRNWVPELPRFYAEDASHGCGRRLPFSGEAAPLGSEVRGGGGAPLLPQFHVMRAVRRRRLGV